MDVFTLSFLKRRIDDACDNNPARNRSTVAAEVYERMPCALQRANADGVINWRYAEYGSALYNTDADPVHAALNSSAINLAECDSDLRKEAVVAVVGVNFQRSGGEAVEGGSQILEDEAQRDLAEAEEDGSRMYAVGIMAEGVVTVGDAPEQGRQ